MDNSLLPGSFGCAYKILYLGVVFKPYSALDSGGDIDRAGPERPDARRDVVRRQAARQDELGQAFERCGFVP